MLGSVTSSKPLFLCLVVDTFRVKYPNRLRKVNGCIERQGDNFHICVVGVRVSEGLLCEHFQYGL